MDGPDVGSMLVHRLRRWPNIDPTLGPCLVQGLGIYHYYEEYMNSMLRSI